MVSSLVYVNYEYCPVLFKNNTVQENLRKIRNDKKFQFVNSWETMQKGFSKWYNKFGNSGEPGMHEGRCEQ